MIHGGHGNCELITYDTVISEFAMCIFGRRILIVCVN
jgi:hypothetical protein